MKLALLPVLCFLLFNAVYGSKSNRQRTLVYRGRTGSLTDQFLEMKKLHMEAEAQQRHLVVVQSKDEENGLSSYNLCDIFELPSLISCEKNLKMKCTNSTSIETKEESQKQKEKKKVSFHCDVAPPVLSAQQISNLVDLLPMGLQAKLLPKRTEEVEYMQAMLGLVSKQPKVLPYTAIYWGRASQFLGKDIGSCVYSAGGDPPPQQGNDDCRQLHAALAQLKEASKPYCTSSVAHLRGGAKDSAQDKTAATSGDSSAVTGVHATGSGLCYIAGAMSATAVEAKLMLAYGLQSFRGAWMQHQEGGTQLVHINPVSVEIMEFGLMLGANKFVSLLAEPLQTIMHSDASLLDSQASGSKAAEFKHAAEVILVNSFVEHERAREGRSHCTAHRDGAIPSDTTATGTASGADVSFCGRLKASDYVYRVGTEHATDDGPFENAALNKFVVNLALSLLAVFSSRILQLGLGFITVLLILGVFRLCYSRWRRTSTKTF